MSRIKIEIDLSNAAFENDAPQEIARIVNKALNKLPRRPCEESQERPLMDYNGNRVGVLTYGGGL
jgi:hypothetical protein